ncbi:endonuclease-reverse transcriptase domain-containing protein [Hirsutella rhossiliensis]|uniref:Endonuclease-reverse transcriptase domain-containing protein n=1 Tax=Hirsutella rhossiliensis TaxID=111463 RepID=A0A9P8MQ61_9HYPO|nr:endonuclease-reverse transcriptase domain-containing protein [Hirsutella rhossiliensis]KAH0957192.1 endonuclease-reverse transcriptase domain-containing protein [Hirsutella rhossiliensis]
MNDEDLKGYRALAISEPGFDSGNPSATRLISNVAGFRGGTGRRADFVVAGDFNRHDLLWGGDEVTARRQGEAQSIIDLINDCGLCSLLPRGTKTWQGRDSESTIDLVLALAELADEMVICNIYPMEHGSDHIVFDDGEPCVDGASLLQAEVVALLGSPAEFTNSSAWAYLNTYLLYWHVFRQESGVGVTDDPLGESVVVEEAGPRISHVEAYQHRGERLRGLCLYDYVSLVRLERNNNGGNLFLSGGQRVGDTADAEQNAVYRFSIICRQLDLIRQNDGGDVGQLCQFIGSEGRTGKSRIIEALAELFRIAAVRINSITIHSTCGFSKDQGAAANTARDLDEVRLPSKRIGSSMASFG